MAVKENVKVEEILDGEEFETTNETENGGEVMNKKINWKLYLKCAAGVAIVGAASIALYKWRKNKKAATTAVVVSTPSNNSGANETVAQPTTVVEI